MRCGKQIENSVGGSGFHVADEYLRGSRETLTAASSGAKQQGDGAKYRLWGARGYKANLRDQVALGRKVRDEAQSLEGTF